VSAADTTCFKPGARSRFFYRIHVHHGRQGERRSMSQADYADLVTDAHQQLHATKIGSLQDLLQAFSREAREANQGQSLVKDTSPDLELSGRGGRI
jgi:hypothetical protein